MMMSNDKGHTWGRRAILAVAAAGTTALPTVLAGTQAEAATPEPDLWATPTGDQWTIQRGKQKATLVELGGGLYDYAVDGVPFVDSYPLDAPIKSAGRVLVPWPNRLGNGQYTFNGVAQQVPINEVARNNAIHGLSRWLQFRPLARTTGSITLHAIIPPQQGYPFPLDVTTRWSLGAAGLRADHTVINLGPVPAPFGLGVHPYFRIGDTLIDTWTLTALATDRLTVDDRLLPNGRVPVAGTPFDFTTPRAIGALEMDTAFTGLTRGSDGRVRVRAATPAGLGFEMWQDRAFPWMQLFTGVGPNGRPRGTLAVEPMTCPPDAFRSGEDLITLAPHAQWTGSWGVTTFG
jgi:aldose 1-epimerase